MWRGFCKRGRNQGTKGLSGQQKRLWINFRKDTEKSRKSLADEKKYVIIFMTVTLYSAKVKNGTEG